MLRRALSLCAVLGLASSAYAGAAITLNAAAPANGVNYVPGETVRVDFLAQLTAGSPASIRVRAIQFDLSDSSAGLVFTPVGNHPLNETYDAVPPDGTFDPIPFWNFSGSSACTNGEADCGTNYFIDGDPSGNGILNTTYSGLTTSGSFMVTLNQTTNKLVGSMNVTMPDAGGAFVLDVLNANEADDNFGAEIRHGFGVTADPGAFILRAETGDIVGAAGSEDGQFAFNVVPEPATLALLGLGGLAAAFRRRSA
jgi:hypothetical protein